MNWLVTWMSNPAMLGLGAIAIASPIIIHLLNKRRFRIVDWAAMDFLFDADKKNRRRIRLENLILLLLRCLAMLLLGFLLARPFFPSELATALGQAQEFQRIMVLDDSLSQRTALGSRPAFEEARDRMKQFLQAISSDGNSDYLTLYLTSRPDRPVWSNAPVTPDSIDAMMQRLDELQCSDKTADYEAALNEVASYVEGSRTKINQLLYVLTDLRVHDWLADGDASTNAPNRMLASLGETVSEIFVVDVGSPLEDNLVVTEMRAEDLLVANKIVRFRVEVANHGSQIAENVRVRLRVEDFQPQIETLEAIAPGQSQFATFRTLFQSDVEEFTRLDTQEQLIKNRLNYRITAEIVQDGLSRDDLIQDSSAYFAAQTLRGVPILIVDGDPSATPERGESYYLEGIGLPGTGLLVDTITAPELETVSLTKYKVIFLCNVDEASEQRVQALTQWVEQGGGLVFFPGDQVSASAFNNAFFRNGEGLSPLRLEHIGGDATRNRWVFMEIADASHPSLSVASDDEMGLGKVEVFSWWHAVIPEEQSGSVVATILKFSNEDNSPAMAEKTVGDGRVVGLAISADADWTMWPAHPTYVCVMWDLVNYLVGNLTDGQTIRVGGSLTETVDLTRYDLRVELVDPNDEKVVATAVPMDASQESQGSVLHHVRFDELDNRGFYQMNLLRQSEAIALQLQPETDALVFAVNVDPGEGNLRRLDLLSLDSDFFGSRTRVIAGDQLVLDYDLGSSLEIWPQVLMLLAAVLAVEQFLGWWFGRRR